MGLPLIYPTPEHVVGAIRQRFHQPPDLDRHYGLRHALIVGALLFAVGYAVLSLL